MDLAAVLDSMVDGVFVCDATGKLIAINRAGLRIAGKFHESFLAGGIDENELDLFLALVSGAITGDCRDCVRAGNQQHVGDFESQDLHGFMS